MRHLPRKKRTSSEVLGHDAAESVENVAAVFGGQRLPQLADRERIRSPARRGGGHDWLEMDA